MFPRQNPPSKLWLLRVAAFMAGSALLITIVSRYYLIPALSAAAHASIHDRAILRAHAALLLALLLFIIFVGWALTFRVGRYFFPKPGSAKRPPATRYPDAWAESAKRVQPLEDDE